MISAGRYRAQAREAQLGYTQGGKEQIAVQFALLDDGTGGAMLTWYGFFTEKTTARTLEALRICGWTGDDLADLAGVTSNEVELVVEPEEGLDGKRRACVRWVNRLGSGSLALKSAMSDQQRREFAARMKGDVIASRQASGPAAAAPAVTAAPAATRRGPRRGPRDDLPF